MRVLLAENAIGFGGSTVCAGHILDACRRADIEPYLLISYDGRGVEADLPPGAVWRLDGYRLFRWARALRRWGQRRASRLPGMLQSLLFMVGWFLLERPCAWLLARRIRRHQIDIVHANNDLLNNRIAICAGRAAGAFVVSHQRGWQWPGRFARRLAKRVNQFVAISIAVEQDLVRAGVNTEKIVQLYDGVDCHALRQRATRPKDLYPFGIPDGRLVIGMPAMLVGWKGQDLFLRAFARIAGKPNNVHALLVGDAPDGNDSYLKALQRLAAELGIADRVTFAGFRPDLAEALACMDVVVHASVEPEPLGLTVLEAMAAEKPVIAADAGGVRETICAPRTGLLYPPGDQAALADCMQRFAGDVSLRETVSRQAADHVTEAFDIQVTTGRIIDVYRSMWVGGFSNSEGKVPCPSKLGCSLQGSC